MQQHGAAGEGMQNLGQTRMHALALTGSEHHDLQGLGGHRGRLLEIKRAES
jgi:hypothetical protein